MDLRGRARRRLRTAAACALALAALGPGSGCEYLRPVTIPIPTVRSSNPRADGSAARQDGASLLVLLPGRGSSAASYEKHGFVRAAREAGLTADILAAEAHLGYYRRRVIHLRLVEDVIAPAREAGVRRVWLGGISLGATGALITAFRYPDEVDGLLLFAPYLGPDDLIAEIAAAGGLRAWQPPADPTDFAALWSWLQGYAARPEERPALVLAFGERDRFAAAARLLADVLPGDRVLRAPGGHDWHTWDGLWRRAVRHPLLQEALAAVAGPRLGEAPQEAPPLSAWRGTR